MANQKAEKLSPKTSAQGYHCDCEQTEFVLLLSVSSATVAAFSSPLFLCHLNLFLLLSQLFTLLHTLHTFQHFYFTLALSYATSFCV